MVTDVTALRHAGEVKAYGAGIPSALIQGIGSPHDTFSNTTAGAFIQDSWRVRQNLTLNFGVRYTYHGVLHDAIGFRDERNGALSGGVVQGVGYLAQAVEAPLQRVMIR